MNTENKLALKLLHGIAVSNEMLISLSQDLRARPEVVRVLHSLEARKHQSGAALEGYVDAELRNGKAICWWMDAYWKEGKWVIECSVLVNNDEGQHIFKEFPSKSAESLDDFITQLERATSDLVASASTINLEADLSMASNSL